MLLHKRRDKSIKKTKEIFHLKQYINILAHKMIVVLLSQASNTFKISKQVNIDEYYEKNERVLHLIF